MMKDWDEDSELKILGTGGTRLYLTRPDWVFGTSLKGRLRHRIVARDLMLRRQRGLIRHGLDPGLRW